MWSFHSSCFISPQVSVSGVECFALNYFRHQSAGLVFWGWNQKDGQNSVKWHRSFNIHRIAPQRQENNSQNDKLLWFSNPCNSTQCQSWIEWVVSALLLLQTKSSTFFMGQDIFLESSAICPCPPKARSC